MLTEEQLEIISDTLSPLFQYLEKEVIVDIARRIQKTLTYSRTAELQAMSMKKLGYSPAKIRKEAMRLLHADTAYRKAVAKNTLEYKKEVMDIINSITKAAYKANNDVVAGAGNMAWVNDLSIWKDAGKELGNNSFLSQLVESFSAQTAGELKNMTQTAGFKTMSGYEAVENAYKKELDKAVIKVCSGTFSQEKVLRDVVHNLAQSGLRSIDFASGYSMQLDTAARVALRTGCHQLAGKVTDKNIEQTGENLVYVSKHWGARNTETGHANHEQWQGKVYFIKEGEDYSQEAERIGQSRITSLWYATGYSVDGSKANDPLGLNGYNCRHNHYPWFEGVSSLPMDQPEPEPVIINGKSYDYYAMTQKMRCLERSIRVLKREKEALKAIGMDTKDIDVKIRRKKNEYDEFCGWCGINPRSSRLRYECGTSDLAKTKAWKEYEVAYKEIKSNSKATSKTAIEVKELKYATFGDYEKYIENAYGVKIDDDVKKLNLAAVQQAFEGTEEVLKDFPDAKQVFGGLNTHNRGIMSVSPMGEVCYNPDIFGTYQDAYISCVSGRGFHPHGSNITSSGYHEAGHLLELALIRKYKPNAVFDEIIEFYRNGIYAEKIVKNACARIVSKKDYFTLVDEVSRYAHRNYSECMAECVSDYYLNRGNAAVLSREVIKEIRRNINVL